MSVAKVVELISSSTQSFDHAIEEGVSRACSTINGVTSAWVKDQKIMIKDNKIVEYRVDLKVTFILK